MVARDTDTFGLYNGKTGELLKALPTGGMRRFSRRKLRALISEGVDMKYGKTLSSISYNDSGSGVSAHFADGTSVSGDVLIGTDGPRSKVRELVVGKERSEARPAGVVAAIVRSKYTAEQALELRQHASLMTIAYHPHGTYTAIFGHDFHSPDPENWEFVTMHSSMLPTFEGSDADADKLKLLKNRAAEYVGIWKNAIEWIPDGTSLSFNHFVYWKTIEFDNKRGRATLAGDAAYPMTP
ncbi:hypothetical protein L207DRAFT_348528 [Hyaloscypha variabilis F]|uniref:FAD/NAD(P)-binding domain-containing protein n=1 Tax=Hyaloscypha variabilis (strain UAMH 11265 / GT02V1 / F) TaxID=1149755 RepID=A0A2J6RRA6_HYAVF|nr:hypothetical protein L207DRAFT_348528 [Hyaloscypha variabilis F]